MEASTGSSVDYLIIIGSICLKHVLDKLRRKVDNKGEQMILIGYHSTRGKKR